MMKRKVLFFLLLLGAGMAVAQTPEDSMFDDSLQKTQNVLQDQAQRDKAISESSDAKKVDEQVKKLAPDENTRAEFYELAADMLNNYKSEKDEEKMKKSIQQGMRNPAEYYKQLTPEQKKKVEELSYKINPGPSQAP